METPSKNMVENLAQPSLDEIAKLNFFKSSTQVALAQRVSQFAFIATFAYKKDQWKITISGLFSKPCCNIKRIFEDYGIKGIG
jgi:hypothetical protein